MVKSSRLVIVAARILEARQPDKALLAGAPYARADRSRFLQALDQALVRLGRTWPAAACPGAAD